jgi:hypothetical protein
MAEYVSRPLGPHIFVKSIRCFSEQEKWFHLCELLKQSTQDKTLVYFQSRRACEWAAQGLQEKGFRAFVYHAGLEKKQRHDMETYIHATQRPKTVVCATTAFGMGVNVLNLSRVIVYGYPSNIEDFFQMLGRAGRSGEASSGVLLWSGSDAFKRKKQLDDLFPPVERLANFWPYFSEFLPKRLYESRLFGAETFALGGPGEIPLKRLELKQEAILACLRFCGLLQDLKSYTTYVSIQFASHMSLDELCAQLPQTPTKRSQAWQALCQLFSTQEEAKQWNGYLGAEGVFSLERWSREAKMEEHEIRKILSYFEEKKEISFKFFETKPQKQNFIVKNNVEFLLKSLPLYRDLRKEFIRSLHELQRLSTAKGCRLKESFSFFVDDATSVDSLESCGQCDLCFHEKGSIYYEKALTHQKQELINAFECYPEAYERAGKTFPHQI